MYDIVGRRLDNKVAAFQGFSLYVSQWRCIPDQAKCLDFRGVRKVGFHCIQVQSFVTLKDKVLQPSHALRHSAELSNIVQTHFKEEESTNHVVLVVSDGGPDHCLTYLSVKVAMIALFKSWICSLLSKHAT